MLSIRAKEIIFKKMSKDRQSFDDEILKAYFMESFYYVCNKCEPRVLTKSLREGNERVLRDIRGGNMIIVPDEPDFSDKNEHLMIDEALSYAVINYVCFLISKCESVEYLKLCDTIINEFISNDGKELENV